MRTLILMTLGVLPPMVSMSANVDWNTAFIDVYPDYSGTHDVCVALGAPPYLPMSGRWIQGGLTLTANTDTFMEYANTFVTASIGDVIDGAYMDKQTEYFLYSEYGAPDSGRTDYAITLLQDEPVYLAFENETSMGSTYGWVEMVLYESGGLTVLASSWNRDGDAIFVGMIPEPDSAILLLFGLMLIALQRASCLETDSKMIK